MDALMLTVIPAVAVIPETLAGIVAIVLAMGANRTAKENVTIKNISSAESLDCASAICSDEAGILTQSKTAVQQVYRNHELLHANNLKESSPLDRLLLLDFALCYDATANEYQRIGDPTEFALVDLLELYRIDELKIRERYLRIDESPSDSERKLMSILHIIDGEDRLLLRGVCDEILKKTTYT